jgi:alkylresorcinol/alkylpyrone synthase
MDNCKPPPLLKHSGGTMRRQERAPARIQSLATAVPPYTISTDMAQSMLRKLAAEWKLRPERLISILEHTCIESRHTVYPPDELLAEHTLGERNRAYVQTSVELGEQVVRRALDDAGLAAEQIDVMITVSCTGFMLPSVDAYLVNRLRMSPQVRRLPITELGCAAGAVGLSRAWEQLQVHPGCQVLLLSIELPSLTFQPNDRRLMQLVSSRLFSDGAAAVIVSAAETGRGPSLLGSRSYTIPGTLAEMGYELDQDGFHIILSAAVPELIRDTIRPQVENLLHDHGLSLADLRWCALHPAGPKVLQVVEKELDLAPEQLAASWKILRDYGNMSSASVLFVLDDMMRHAAAQPGEIGILVAFGPGMSGEIVLARWEGECGP